MGRKLSLFCCCPCLPHKQRDNLSSRSLYPDQDSSGQDEYYTDEDEAENTNTNDYAHFHHNNSRRNHQHRNSNSSSSNNNTYENPWPSNFFNGRFSRQANRSRSSDGVGPSHGRSHGLAGRSSSRKPNPFRTPRHDDDQDRVEETGVTSFEPYHDDDSDDDNNTSQVTQEPGHEGQNALNNPTAIHPKMAYTPYRVQTGSPSTNPSRKRVRAPRNPQGKMAWMDDEDEEDANEVIDVDALIAEQERITRELAAQEEALRKEEEATIVTKRLAAIRAAEKRGLLRFEGDQLVISGNNSSNNSNAEPSVQDEGEWNYSRREKNQHYQSMERAPSTASSFVGGVDAFNQELKMMNLEMSRQERSKQKQPHHYYSSEESKNVQKWLATTTDASTVSLPASPTVLSRAGSTTSGSTARPTTPARTTSTGVSTSTSTSTSGPSVAINPRGVFNNIASFLKKVDGVIAGDNGDSSDEADKEQQGVPANNVNGPQALVKMSNGQRDEEGMSADVGGYSTRAIESLDKSAVVAISLDSEEREQTYPEDPFNSLTNRQLPSDAQDEDEDQSYPADPFNTSSRKDTHSSSSKSSVSGKRSVRTEPVVVPVATPAAPERMISTFSSIFNTGSSLMGSLFGGGSVGIGGIGLDDDPSKEDDYDYDGDRRRKNDGRRLSSLKYGDPMTHQFNYREYHLEGDHGGGATGAHKTKTAGNEGEDSDSLDDYDF